ncbi:membrane-associated protein, putative [Bodo saltans]|uniref:Membrane-associated protein, putative n=1 Tax=Bodo saltans TaxID=75058 RepID=A0A0S4IT00_BODSA|nr:membrane-associated protein, putative [Bodo saltans]|eukprot:CUF76244.1 membrane-associated protein, putative [Bodo saltans]
MRKFRGGGAAASFGRHHSGGSRSDAKRLMFFVALFAVVVFGGVLMLLRAFHQSSPSISANAEEKQKSAPESEPIISENATPDFRSKMEDAVRRSHNNGLHEAGGSGNGDGDDLRKKREAEVLSIIDRMRSNRRRGDASADNDDFAALERARKASGGGQPLLNIDEKIARNLEEQKKQFEEFLERSRHIDLHHRRRDALGHIGADSQNRPSLHSLDGVQDNRRRSELERRLLDDLRRTAFGAGGAATKTDAPTSADNNDSHQRNRSGHWGGGVPTLRLALFTTFKSCDEIRIRYAQLDAVTSWVSLPIYPAPTVLLMGGDVQCSKWVADIVNKEHNEIFGVPDDGAEVVRVIEDAKKGASGATLLLGSAVERLHQEVPDADVYGLINADILLDPLGSVALHRIAGHYREFFVVGHRFSVNIPLERRASFHRHPWRAGDDSAATTSKKSSEDEGLDFYLPGWSYEGDSMFARATPDRVDAEDFFFWSRDFFRQASPSSTTAAGDQQPQPGPTYVVPPPHAALSIPDFHIGRPAYDNWLVHHAIHTWKPTVDATEMLLAFHQSHDYRHLEKPQNAQKGADDDVGAGDTKKKAASYWGGVEQKENYDLGLTNGGWQHGSMDMVPLALEPSGCSEVIRHQAVEQTKHHKRSALVMRAFQHGPEDSHRASPREALGKMLFDWFAFTVTEERAKAHRGANTRSGRECAIKLRSGWRPFSDNAPAELSSQTDYMRQYDAYHNTDSS